LFGSCDSDLLSPHWHPLLLLQECFLHPCHLISSGEIQSILHLCISPLSWLLIL
jgi:hypothetical protein